VGRVKSTKNVTEREWFPQIRMLPKPTTSFLCVCDLGAGLTVVTG